MSLMKKCKITKRYLAINLTCSEDIEGFLRTLGVNYKKRSDSYIIEPWDLICFLDLITKSGWSIELRVNTDFKTDIFSDKKVELRNYQKNILKRVKQNNFRAIIILPTGAGKTILALKIMQILGAKTLVVVPTIDLLYQWKSKMVNVMGVNEANIGLFGGGKKELKQITITTYQSAINPDNLNRFMDFFGLVIFDEVHRIGYRYIEIAKRLIAPFRIGLSATLEDKEKRAMLSRYIGKVIQEYETDQLILSGYLADYELKLIKVSLSKTERKRYLAWVKKYANYLEMEGLKKVKGKISKILMKKAETDPEAREALKAIRNARDLAFFPKSKIEAIEKILMQHKKDKVIIFTRHKRVAGIISYLFCIPLITGETPSNLRKEFLRLFRENKLSKLVAAEALDEGIDIPGASVGIIVSGRASNRQYVQRIGRLLRPKGGKKAIIYELVTEGTIEEKVSRVRKQVNLNNI